MGILSSAHAAMGLKEAGVALPSQRAYSVASEQLASTNACQARSSSEQALRGAAFPQVPPREALLNEAKSIVLGDRNATYGNPEDNFANIAAYWQAYFLQRFGEVLDIRPQDVAHLMILMKMARLATNRSHRDSLVDIAGYAACAADCQPTSSV